MTCQTGRTGITFSLAQPAVCNIHQPVPGSEDNIEVVDKHSPRKNKKKQRIVLELDSLSDYDFIP